MASGADQEDLERKFRDYMQSFAEKGHLTCPVCGELAWEYGSSSLATANRIALRCIHCGALLYLDGEFVREKLSEEPEQYDFEDEKAGLVSSIFSSIFNH